MKLKSVILSILVFCSLIVSAQAEYGLQVGDEMPDFEFYDDRGQAFKSSDLKAKVVVITFYATWCGSCRRELPLLDNQIWKKYKDNPDFKFLAFGRKHKQSEVDRFKLQQHYKMPMYADPMSEIYDQFASRYIPRMFVVDKKGVIAYFTIGFNEYDVDEIDLAVKTLLEE